MPFPSSRSPYRIAQFNYKSVNFGPWQSLKKPCTRGETTTTYRFALFVLLLLCNINDLIMENTRCWCVLKSWLISRVLSSPWMHNNVCFSVFKKVPLCIAVSFCPWQCKIQLKLQKANDVNTFICILNSKSHDKILTN